MSDLDLDLGDIRMDGKPFKVELSSWRGKDVIDFAPRATVPGGAAVMSDLGMFQPLYQTDWRHGFGFHWYSDAAGYQKTVGDLDTRHDGLVLRMTQSVSSDTDNNLKSGIVPFNGKLYSYGDAGLREYTPAGGWSFIWAGVINFAMAAGDYLFFCPDGARIKKMTADYTITDAGLDANATDYQWLILHNGYIYAAKHGAHYIHFDNSSTLATLQGNATDTNRITVGVGNEQLRGAIVYNGNLYVARKDGIWHIGEDRIARRMLDFSMEESTSNFLGMAVINGYLVFGMRDRVFQWNGARVTDITPNKINDAWPYTTYGQFACFVAVGNYLYCIGRTNEATQEVDLLCFDGVGWHKLTDLFASNSDSVGMLAYEAINNRLWWHKNATADVTYYIQFQDRSEFPYANFATTGSHYLVSSRLDMGFRRVKKSFDKLNVEAKGLSSGVYMAVYYSIDGAAWVLWDNVTIDGVTILRNPGGSQARDFYYLRLRFDFITGTATLTPVLEGWSLSFIMRPETRMGYNFNVYATTHFQHGMHQDERTAEEIRAELMAIRNSVNPVELIDIYGVTHMGYLTAIQEQPTYRSEQEGGDVEVIFRANFVEI